MVVNAHNLANPVTHPAPATPLCDADRALLAALLALESTGAPNDGGRGAHAAAPASAGLDDLDLPIWFAQPRIQDYIKQVRALWDFLDTQQARAARQEGLEILRALARTAESAVEKRRIAAALLRPPVRPPGSTTSTNRSSSPKPRIGPRGTVLAVSTRGRDQQNCSTDRTSRADPAPPQDQHSAPHTRAQPPDESRPEALPEPDLSGSTPTDAEVQEALRWAVAILTDSSTAMPDSPDIKPPDSS
ncbi:MAG: hypothetical protein H6811_04365 [Phycisphaeraceae bacterium]|nr:hypothetical protein [Phycisphaeraceae bacterium]